MKLFFPRRTTNKIWQYLALFETGLIEDPHKKKLDCRLKRTMRGIAALIKKKVWNALKMHYIFFLQYISGDRISFVRFVHYLHFHTLDQFTLVRALNNWILLRECRFSNSEISITQIAFIYLLFVVALVIRDSNFTLFNSIRSSLHFCMYVFMRIGGMGQEVIEVDGILIHFDLETANNWPCCPTDKIRTHDNISCRISFLCLSIFSIRHWNLITQKSRPDFHYNQLKHSNCFYYYLSSFFFSRKLHFNLITVSYWKYPISNR